MEGWTDISLKSELCSGCKSRFVAESSLSGDFIDAKDSMKEKFNINIGTLLACARCKKNKYCSKSCQRHDWKHHKPFCIEKLSEFDSDVDRYIEDRTHYDEIASLEVVIFQELNKCAHVEAMAFPFLFPFGAKFFDCPTISTKRRFCDYRRQMLAYKPFKGDVQWQAWALQTEKEVYEELRKRITRKFIETK
jgi:hypothetical protein